jgi:hypothetical protein
VRDSRSKGCIQVIVLLNTVWTAVIERQITRDGQGAEILFEICLIRDRTHLILVLNAHRHQNLKSGII